MDQTTQGAPDVNNDGIGDNAAAPVTNPQPAPADAAASAAGETASQPAADPEPTEPAPADAATPAQAPADAAAPSVLPPAAAAPHKSSRLLLYVLVGVTVLVLAAAAFFALAP